MNILLGVLSLPLTQKYMQMLDKVPIMNPNIYSKEEIEEFQFTSSFVD